MFFGSVQSILIEYWSVQRVRVHMPAGVCVCVDGRVYMRVCVHIFE